MSHRDTLASGLSIEQREALKNPTRRTLYHHIHHNPGVTIRDLARKRAIAFGTVYRHLQVLQDLNLVQKQREGRTVHLFTLASGGEAPAPRSKETSTAAARQVAKTILQYPGLSAPALMKQLPKLSSSIVYYHLRRLLDAGLITSARTRRYVDLQPTPALTRALGNKNQRGKPGG